MAEDAADDISEDVLPLPPRLEERSELEVGAPGIENIGSVCIKDDRTVNDQLEENNENVLHLQSGHEEGLHLGTMDTSGIEGENRRYDTREYEHSTEDNEPKMEELKGDSLLDDNDSESDSVLNEITYPHENWAFNKLIMKVSEGLSKDDLEYMKGMYYGEIGRKDLEHIVNPMQLFDIMKKRMFLSPVNLLQLECLLWDRSRTDLMQLVIDYAQRTKNVVYMHPATYQPVNGYKHVKFHVSGKDFTKMKKEELCHITSVVANVLDMSPKFVLIDGVDPTESVSVTILLPEKQAVDLQSKLQKRTSDILMFVYVGIDKITLDCQVYDVLDSNLKAKFDSSEEELEQVSTFRRYQEAKNLVSNLEMEIQNLEAKVIILEAEIETSKGCAVPNSLQKYTGNVSEEYCRGQYELEQQKIEVALENFSKTLRQTSDAGYNKQLLLQLLRSHVVFVATRCYHELSVGISKQHQQVQEQLSGIAIHRARCEVMRYLWGGTDDEPAEIKASRDISKKLRSSEKEKLLKKYIMTKDDGELIQEGSVPFLLIILNKEYERNENAINITEFIAQSLLYIDRRDLLIQFHGQKRKYEQERKRAREDKRSIDSESRYTQTEEQDDRKDKEQKQDDTANDIKRIAKDVELIKKALLEAPVLENLSNMKSEYQYLLYNNPIVQGNN